MRCTRLGFEVAFCIVLAMKQSVEHKNRVILLMNVHDNCSSHTMTIVISYSTKLFSPASYSCPRGVS